MNLTKKEFAEIVRLHPNDSDKVYDAVKAAESLNQSIESVQCQLAGLRDRYEKERVALESELKRFRSLCKHYTWSFHPDPSGNNDSRNICDRCGKEL